MNNNNSTIELENNIQDNQQEYTNSSLSNQQQDEKLPLKNAWGIYFYKADKQKDWKQNVIYITSINYVEDFWSFYTHTYGLRDLSNGSDYMFFKVMIKVDLKLKRSCFFFLLI